MNSKYQDVNVIFEPYDKEKILKKLFFNRELIYYPLEIENFINKTENTFVFKFEDLIENREKNLEKIIFLEKKIVEWKLKFSNIDKIQEKKKILEKIQFLIPNLPKNLFDMIPYVSQSSQEDFIKIDNYFFGFLSEDFIPTNKIIPLSQFKEEIFSSELFFKKLNFEFEKFKKENFKFLSILKELKYFYSFLNFCEESILEKKGINFFKFLISKRDISLFKKIFKENTFVLDEDTKIDSPASFVGTSFSDYVGIIYGGVNSWELNPSFLINFLFVLLNGIILGDFGYGFFLFFSSFFFKQKYFPSPNILRISGIFTMLMGIFIYDEFFSIHKSFSNLFKIKLGLISKIDDFETILILSFLFGNFILILFNIYGVINFFYLSKIDKKIYFLKKIFSNSLNVIFYSTFLLLYHGFYRLSFFLYFLILIMKGYLEKIQGIIKTFKLLIYSISFLRIAIGLIMKGFLGYIGNIFLKKLFLIPIIKYFGIAFFIFYHGCLFFYGIYTVSLYCFRLLLIELLPFTIYGEIQISNNYSPMNNLKIE